MADDLDVEAMLEAPYKEKVQTYNERKGYCYNKVALFCKIVELSYIYVFYLQRNLSSAFVTLDFSLCQSKYSI